MAKKQNLPNDDEVIEIHETNEVKVEETKKANNEKKITISLTDSMFVVLLFICTIALCLVFNFVFTFTFAVAWLRALFFVVTIAPSCYGLYLMIKKGEKGEQKNLQLFLCGLAFILTFLIF